MNTYTPSNNAVLRRLLEPKLGASVGVVDQAPARMAHADGHVKRIDDELGAQMPGHGPAHDPAAEDIDDDRAGFYHARFDEFGYADGCNDNVGLKNHFREIFCAGMTHGDRGIGPFGLLHHDCGHGFTDDVGSPDDHNVFTGRIVAVAHE